MRPFGGGEKLPAALDGGLLVSRAGGVRDREELDMFLSLQSVLLHWHPKSYGRTSCQTLEYPRANTMHQ